MTDLAQLPLDNPAVADLLQATTYLASYLSAVLPHVERASDGQVPTMADVIGGYPDAGPRALMAEIVGDLMVDGVIQ